MESSRQILNFNQAWRFHRIDDPNEKQDNYHLRQFDDLNWELVNIPHTVRLVPYNGSGGTNFQGLCWYRKHFQLETEWKERKKKLFIEFEGLMQVADVWLNDQFLMTHYGGYLPCLIDITDFVQFDNLIAVRLDNRNQPLVPPGKPQQELDFTYAGGLYRNVHFLVLNRLHITNELETKDSGIFVSFQQVSHESATIEINTNVHNEFAQQTEICHLTHELIDSQGQIVVTISSEPLPIKPNATMTFTLEMNVRNPQLWHPEHPYLYTLLTRVFDDSSNFVLDDLSIQIGIRTIQFQLDGLYINSEKFFSFGINHHQDNLYVGNAVCDSEHYRDVMKLRQAGMTSFRSHYPHARAFMDACDQLGILCIVSTPGWQYFNEDQVFLARCYQNTREMIRLNRNRPSIILWEIALNETSYNEEYARTSYQIAHDEYPLGDKCYASGDARMPYQRTDPIFDVIYFETQFPLPENKRPMWWREFGDAWDLNWTDQVADNRVKREWGEHAMLLQAKRHQQSLSKVMNTSNPSVCGCGLWAGIDCDRGYHPMPFLGGILDKCRLPKFSYYMFKSQTFDPKMVFIANLMTRYSPRDVTVFSNCEAVQLFRDDGEGKGWILVGEQKVVSDGNLPHLPAVFESAYDQCDQRRLKANGLVDEEVVCEHVITSPGVARALVLTVDDCGRYLTADGSDFIRVYATIIDEKQSTVPFNDCSISYTVQGVGTILGDRAGIEANPVRSELGIATALIQTTLVPGKIIVTASAQGLKKATLEFESVQLKQKNCKRQRFV